MVSREMGRLPVDGADGGPRSKMAFAAGGGGRKAWNGFNDSRLLPVEHMCGAAGLRSWAREIACRQHFPPYEEAALGREANCSAGRAPQQFLPHLEKAWVLSKYCHNWEAKPVAQAATGLARPGGRINPLKPAVRRN